MGNMRLAEAVATAVLMFAPFAASAQNTAESVAAENVAVAESAAPAENIALADSVAVLDGRVSKLEKIISKLPTVSGFVQVQYSWSEEESVFQVYRARITFSGKIYKDFADYCITPEFAGSVRLLDAFVRITPFRQLNLQAGAFRPAFTIENVFYGATSMEAIDFPQVVRRMTTIDDVTGIKGGGRDVGVQLYGGFFNQRGFSTLEYKIGVFNGAGLSAKDTDSSKDVAAMLIVNPIKHLALVGSMYYGGCRAADKRYYARNRWDAGFRYDDGKFFARGEYIWGMTGGVKDYADNLRSEGAYVMAGVWFLEHRLAPLARVEYYAENLRDRRNTAEQYYTVGVLYSPFKYLRFQANYTYRASADRAVEPLNQIRVMLTGMF